MGTVTIFSFGRQGWSGVEDAGQGEDHASNARAVAQGSRRPDAQAESEVSSRIRPLGAAAGALPDGQTGWRPTA